ncbi:zinc-binding alcohol dehydrogenase family protein [Bradyrhizobium ontarionense]|uniref:Zinc-binding alcohol dehydrogenase family protein n=1 Tax=Bradyrhizobium ontarionense TaxID=2898149 RepID=A0ABY3R938_9BRAD|nr:zinc-binding alcohol dehydrogenase family protein [Bradyrhizobium sp. A19]UFZ03552.1 zinc-binding alcohol dehydrogenase family protein [Bradyrhizobium sp. A19]
MKAAIVQQTGQPPVYGDFADPIAAHGEHLITVTAAAISQITKGRASGTHYSSSGAFPFVPGVDGVGRCENGSRVYFVLPRAPHGGMAEQTVVPRERCLALPDGLDDVTAAAIANPGLSSWAALRERAKLQAGETVLINGATGTAGRLAIQIAKYLGAAKVIATGRNAETLQSLTALGADVIIPLAGDGDALEERFKPQFAEGVDIVLDYLWGDSAERLLIAAAKAGAEARPIRFVQVGSVSGGDITLPSAVLRASAIELIGSGIGSIPLERLIAVTGELLQATIPAGLKIAVDPVPLQDIEQAWRRDDSSKRIVVTMGI